MLHIHIITRKAQYTNNNDRIIIKVKNLKINCAFIFNFNNKSLYRNTDRLLRFTYRQNVLGKCNNFNEFNKMASNDRSTITRIKMDKKSIW